MVTGDGNHKATQHRGVDETRVDDGMNLMGRQSHDLLLCLSLLILCTAVPVISGDEAATDQSESSGLRPRMLLDQAEEAIHSLRSVWGAQQSAVRAAVGSFLLLFGGHFTHTVLFVQSFRTAGWPIMESGITKLGGSYKSARTALKKEMPTLMKTRELLPKLSKEVQETFTLLHEAQVKVTALTKDVEEFQQKAVQAQTMWKRFNRLQATGHAGPSPSGEDVGRMKDEALQLLSEAQEKLSEAAAIQDKAAAQYEDAKALYAEALKTMNSMRAVVAAVDPAHVQEIIQGMGAGLLSCVAAAKAHVAANAVVGVDVGRILSARLVPVLHSQLERRVPMDASASRWLDSGVSSVCSGVGLLLAYKVQPSRHGVCACCVRRALAACVGRRCRGRLAKLVERGPLFSAGAETRGWEGAQMQDAMLTGSASMMGAHLLSKCLADQVDYFFGVNLQKLTVERALIPRASKLVPLPSSAGGRLAKLSAAHGIEAVLAGAGLYWQFVGGGRTLETGEKAVFAPFLAVETWLRGMASPTAAAA